MPDIEQLRSPVPPMEEQRRIADFLDAETARIDTLRERLRDVVLLLGKREQAQLDGAIESLATRSGSLPFRRFILRVEQGTSPQCEAAPAEDDEWGVLKVSCLRPGTFLPEENKKLPANVEPDRRYEVREGDLLITRANTPQLVGSTAVAHTGRARLLLSDKIFRVRTAGNLEPAFLAVVARTSRIRALCAATSNGASQSMANIRFEEIKQWPIPVTRLSEQRAIIAEVSRTAESVQRLRTSARRQIALLAERRLALITAAVTGQIDVTTASGRGIGD